ncbi:hypothetical protein Leucomu_13170 [Leucobacter muris]|uniref:DUF3168 domain-containing protein n=1 Tax=Leucobacter muris TaxID=1935379 RepID=A0ABX5QGX5_9MICO|nr:hypothetical protein [Leucobacter muris]QAB18329.1 hypothetical protein Leucomu_10740 [Leucobacter muris]QAB18732.1 hypothetical protein Leucomu_13170 [Leucobacter muris]
MAGELLDPDIERFLTGEIRTRLAALAGAEFPAAKGHVSNRRWTPPAAAPATPPPAWQVIVRDDGINDVDISLGDAGVGIVCLAGSQDNPGPAIRLAKLVKAIVKASPRPGPSSPVAAVLEFHGPYPVPEDSQYEQRYMTCSLAVVSTPL